MIRPRGNIFGQLRGQRHVGSAFARGLVSEPPPPPPGTLHDWSVPVALHPTTLQGWIDLGIIEPTITSADAIALGAPWSTWDTRQETWGDHLWINDKFGNYYDRVYAHYVRWMRTGDSKWRDRASEILIDYRTSMENIQNIIDNGPPVVYAPTPYRTSPHNSFPRGLALHWLITGDTQSKAGLPLFANALKTYRSSDPAYRYNEGRIQAYSMEAQLLAWKVGDVSQPWGTYADEFVANWAAHQQPDGSFNYRLNTELSPCVPPNTTNCSRMGQSNFMEGLRAEALMEYDRLRPGNPLVEQIIVGMAEYMRDTQWRADLGSFYYHSWNTTVTQSDTPLLNHLIVALLGRAYQYTGDASFKTVADAAWDAMEPPFLPVYTSTGAGEFLQSSKPFNQHYRYSATYLAQRLP